MQLRWWENPLHVAADQNIACDIPFTPQLELMFAWFSEVEWKSDEINQRRHLPQRLPLMIPCSVFAQSYFGRQILARKKSETETGLDLTRQKSCCANLYFQIQVAKFIIYFFFFTKIISKLILAEVNRTCMYSSKMGGSTTKESEVLESYEQFKQYFSNEKRSMHSIKEAFLSLI